MGPGTGIAPGSARTGLPRRPCEPFWDNSVALGVPTASGTPDPLPAGSGDAGVPCKQPGPTRGALDVCDRNARERATAPRVEPTRTGDFQVECINIPNGPIPWSFERFTQRGTTPSIDEETGESVGRGIELLGNDRARDTLAPIIRGSASKCDGQRSAARTTE
jgi:hypothetical protein